SISDNFSKDNGGSIPPNLLAIANTESNGSYTRYCQTHKIKIHPARFPEELPDYFIRMLTNKCDFVLDPFAGSCMTGYVAEKNDRKWVCCELIQEYVDGAIGRFVDVECDKNHGKSNTEDDYYQIPKASLCNSNNHVVLTDEGGKTRVTKKQSSDR
ncbi:MAG: site-specific DNA-methyltransferase, partial [Paludibacteraceae bacterium]|nr:site-specific DNA-methyltransferase [Paludibacteraceae bacterium]